MFARFYGRSSDLANFIFEIFPKQQHELLLLLPSCRQNFSRIGEVKRKKKWTSVGSPLSVSYVHSLSITLSSSIEEPMKGL